MHLDMAGVNHQPLQVGVTGHQGQQFGPLAALLPAPEAVGGGVPVAVVRGQGAPGRMIQNTALMKRRLSWAGRPTLPGRPARWGAMMFQARSEMP